MADKCVIIDGVRVRVGKGYNPERDNAAMKWIIEAAKKRLESEQESDTIES